MYDILQTIAYYSIGCLIILTLLTILVSCESIRYSIKCSFFAVCMTISPGLFLPLSLLRIGDWRNALPTAWCIKKCMNMLGVTLHVRGKENIVKNSGCVVLINHQSGLDVAVVSELWPILERCTVVVKKEILYFGLFGIACWSWGSIFINRQKSAEAHNALNSAVKHITDLKKKVIIFPEGHRHSGSVLIPFKKGAFHLAISSQMPIQPIIISKYYFLNAKLKIFNSGECSATILPPISTEGLSKADLPALMEKTYEIMNKTFLETSEESLNDHMKSLKNE